MESTAIKKKLKHQCMWGKIMDEEHLQTETTTSENFWKDGAIEQMAEREFYHLQAAEELEKRISAIQRSTHSDIQFMARSHNYLRMKFRWYYIWHTLRSANTIHYSLLILFMLAILIKIYLAFH